MGFSLVSLPVMILFISLLRLYRRDPFSFVLSLMGGCAARRAPASGCNLIIQMLDPPAPKEEV